MLTSVERKSRSHSGTSSGWFNIYPRLHKNVSGSWVKTETSCSFLRDVTLSCTYVGMNCGRALAISGQLRFRFPLDSSSKNFVHDAPSTPVLALVRYFRFAETTKKTPSFTVPSIPTKRTRTS